MDKTNSENTTDSQSTNKAALPTKLKIKEEDFMRLSKNGKFTPTVHEIESLIINGEVTYTEYRVLLFIKMKTVNFWNTEIRLKRADIQEALKIAKKQCGAAINSLVKNKYLIEMADKDDYYYYGLNPYTFGGLFIVKSVEEGHLRINRSLKPLALLESLRASKRVKKTSVWSQKAAEWESKRLPKTNPSTEIHSDSQMLKYILLKYTLLNGFSEARGEMILGIINEIKNPEFMIKQLVALIQKYPTYGRAIIEEMVRAHTHKTDAFNQRLKTNALAYIVSCWEELKIHFQSVPHFSLDTGEEATRLRKELSELIAEYPIESNQGGKIYEFKSGT